MTQAIRSTPLLTLACICLLLGGCASASKLNPFGGGTKEQDLTRAPQGSIGYQCEGGKRLFVRNLDTGAAVWVILQEREFRLDKTTAAAPATAAAAASPPPAAAVTRYSNGATTLDFKGTDAALTEGNAITYANCKQQAAR
jgi:membrane-bound inhibitor of C-type lysozyme